MLTARLPYAMLADELMQLVVHAPSGERDAPFALTCEAARVFCRLAALHHDDEYRRTAVLAVDTDYVREATQTLDDAGAFSAANWASKRRPSVSHSPNGSICDKSAI